MEKISIIEKESHLQIGKFPGHLERISELKIPIDLNKIKRGEYDELLTEARNSILNDQNLLDKILQAVTAKTEGGSVIKFAEVENILVEKCINLTLNDIENLIRQLGKKFLVYTRQGDKMSRVIGRVREELVTGRFNIDSRGIKSVVSFIRERVRLLLSRPEQKFIIGFNNRLDASRKIDLIEIIFGENILTIDQLNFIQIKSSQPLEGEIDNIVTEHRDFANRDILSLEEIENSELPTQRIEINSVNSLVAVGPKIISQQKVYDSKTSNRGALAATM